MDNEELKRICVAIITQAMKDFKYMPDERISIEQDLKSDWGRQILSALGLSYENIDKVLRMTEINQRHKQFLTKLKKLNDQSEITGNKKLTEESLAAELNWSLYEVLGHIREYNLNIFAKKIKGVNA